MQQQQVVVVVGMPLVGCRAQQQQRGSWGVMKAWRAQGVGGPPNPQQQQQQQVVVVVSTLWQAAVQQQQQARGASRAPQGSV
jgi:hypothetical protein